MIQDMVNSALDALPVEQPPARSPRKQTPGALSPRSQKRQNLKKLVFKVLLFAACVSLGFMIWFVRKAKGNVFSSGETLLETPTANTKFSHQHFSHESSQSEQVEKQTESQNNNDVYNRIQQVKKQTDGDKEAQVDMQTDGEREAQVDMQTDGEKETQVEKEEDREGEAQVDMQTDGEKEAQMEKEEDGEGETQVEKETEGEGEDQVDMQTNGGAEGEGQVEKEGEETTEEEDTAEPEMETIEDTVKDPLETETKQEEDVRNYTTSSPKCVVEFCSRQDRLNRVSKHVVQALNKFNSKQCQAARLKTGHKEDGTYGSFGRAKCNTARFSEEASDERGSQVLVSIPYRLLYIPNMKGASLTFKNLMMNRFHAIAVGTHNLEDFLLEHELTREDLFVFTFVREPLSAFYSAYSEIDKRTVRLKTGPSRVFQDLNRTLDLEPRRAQECLNMVRYGEMRKALTPAHMHSQVWKTQRCFRPSEDKTSVIDLSIDFVGTLENIDEDFKHLEFVVGVNHRTLKKVHTKTTSFKVHASRLKERHETALEKEACKYLAADYLCFPYELPSVCQNL